VINPQTGLTLPKPILMRLTRKCGSLEIVLLFMLSVFPLVWKSEQR